MRILEGTPNADHELARALLAIQHPAYAREAILIGDRPAGSTGHGTDIVRHATAAITAHGFAPRHVFSSTDANIPMSLGIPAIKIGSGGTSGRAHSLEEWIDVEKSNSLNGMAAGLTAILAVAGVTE